MLNRTCERRARALWLCALALVGSGCAARQPIRSFPDLQTRLHPGTTVYVIDRGGTETKGKVVEVSASALVLDVNGSRRRMEQSSVLEVQNRGDSLWNGALIGLGVGVSALLISDPAYERCTNDPRNVCANPHAGERFLAVAIMGAAGAGIDALIRSRHDVYLAPGEGRPAASAGLALRGPEGSASIGLVRRDPSSSMVCAGAGSIAQLSNCLRTSSVTTTSTQRMK
jgi:hypothetical protein